MIEGVQTARVDGSPTMSVRRFYKQAAPSADGLGVMLDERALKTPKGTLFRVPNRALALAIAGEWQAQRDHIVPASMPLTQLAFAALDGERTERALYVAKFGETDLCCHRAEAPRELVARQADAWDALVAWGAERLGVALPIVVGVVAAPVSRQAIDRLYACALAYDDFRLMALAQATGLTGSALVGFALVERHMDAEAAFAATALDDLWSQERWGEDREARNKLDQLRADLDSLGEFLSAVEAP